MTKEFAHPSYLYQAGIMILVRYRKSIQHFQSILDGSEQKLSRASDCILRVCELI
jgi:hypothetical protein